MGDGEKEERTYNQLIHPDYDAWELAINDCTVVFSQAIMVIDGAYMDTIDEKSSSSITANARFERQAQKALQGTPRFY
eukprot:scaffold25903_cov52-Attheya_sp.AAC.2